MFFWSIEKKLKVHNDKDAVEEVENHVLIAYLFLELAGRAIAINQNHNHDNIKDSKDEVGNVLLYEPITETKRTFTLVDHLKGDIGH